MHIWERKGLHAAVGLFIATSIIANKQLAEFLLFFLLVTGIFISYLSKIIQIPLITKLLDRMERPEDRDWIPGKGFLCMLAGAILSTVFFTSRVAAVSMIVLAVGDSLNHITGRIIKRLKKSKKLKAWEGAIFGTIASTTVSSLILPWYIVIFASGIALGVEVNTNSLKTLFFDDNITVPLITGTIITIIIRLFL